MQDQCQRNNPNQLNCDHSNEKMTFHFQSINIIGGEYIGEKDQPEQYREKQNWVPLPEKKKYQQETEHRN